MMVDCVQVLSSWFDPSLVYLVEPFVFDDWSQRIITKGNDSLGQSLGTLPQQLNLPTQDELHDDSFGDPMTIYVARAQEYGVQYLFGECASVNGRAVMKVLSMVFSMVLSEEEEEEKKREV
ncbi:hypothetical protein HAX54_036152, partial [Datura stramonium]|nr:hypothetical protein [Datura stramonium]